MLMRLAMMMASVGFRYFLERFTEVAVFSSSIGSSARFSVSLFRGVLKNPTEKSGEREAEASQ